MRPQRPFSKRAEHTTHALCVQYTVAQMTKNYLESSDPNMLNYTYWVDSCLLGPCGLGLLFQHQVVEMPMDF